MSTLTLAMEEMQNRYGISNTKASSLISGLLSFINQQTGGIGGFIERFRSAGLGDQLSSWFSGATRSLSPEQVESVLGTGTVSYLASKAGLTIATASSAIALILPKLMQSLAPGGVAPTRLPSELMSYVNGPVAVANDGARQATAIAEQATDRSRGSRFLWPLLMLLAALLLGIWIWARGTAPAPAFNADEQVRLAEEKATAALAALKPGFSADNLVTALNLDIINFSSGSATIPPDAMGFLDKAAVDIRSMPTSTTLEISGHTDNTGDPASNLELSQERADAVRNYLVAQGVSPSGLVAKGYGETRPFASNDTEEGKFRNRRIEFAVIR